MKEKTIISLAQALTSAGFEILSLAGEVDYADRFVFELKITPIPEPKSGTPPPEAKNNP